MMVHIKYTYLLFMTIFRLLVSQTLTKVFLNLISLSDCFSLRKEITKVVSNGCVQEVKMTTKCSGRYSNTLPEPTLKMRTSTWPHQSAQSGKKMNSMKNVSILTQNIKLTHQNLTLLMSTLLVVQLWQFSQGTIHISNLITSS